MSKSNENVADTAAAAMAAGLEPLKIQVTITGAEPPLAEELRASPAPFNVLHDKGFVVDKPAEARDAVAVVAPKRRPAKKAAPKKAKRVDSALIEKAARAGAKAAGHRWTATYGDHAFEVAKAIAMQPRSSTARAAHPSFRYAVRKVLDEAKKPALPRFKKGDAVKWGVDHPKIGRVVAVVAPKKDPAPIFAKLGYVRLHTELGFPRDHETYIVEARPINPAFAVGGVPVGGKPGPKKLYWPNVKQLQPATAKEVERVYLAAKPSRATGAKGKAGKKA